MYKHFFGTRNNFKQFVDYYYTLKKLHDNTFSVVETYNIIQERLIEFGVFKYATGVMWIMENVLGLGKEYLPILENKVIGQIILSESMKYGTFSNNKLFKVLQMSFRNFSLVRYFPSEVFSGISFLIWHQLWKIRVKLSL